MKSHYNQEHTVDQINAILDDIKGCVKNNKFIIAMNKNRQENVKFINEYNIRADKQKSIILQLQAKDFCHSLKNTNVGFGHEILYVFVLSMQLINVYGEDEMIDIYMKFNIIKSRSNINTVVISFHERNKPIDYAFK